MHKRYIALDKAKKGYVSVDDISKIPEIEKNPLRFYICQYLAEQSGQNDQISFETFMKLMDIFKYGKVQDQYKCISINNKI
jgi:Ca2+-binding EF-hand superfamily protein